MERRKGICDLKKSVGRLVNTAVKCLRMRELLSELSFQLLQRLRKSIYLGAFIIKALEKRVNKITRGYKHKKTFF